MYLDIAASINKLGKIGVLGTHSTALACLAVRVSCVSCVVVSCCQLTLGRAMMQKIVNNVGLSYDWPTKYLNLPKETEEALIQMNIKTMHELTRIVLPLMVQKYATQPCVAARVASSRAERHRVSLSSFSDQQPQGRDHQLVVVHGLHSHSPPQRLQRGQGLRQLLLRRSRARVRTTRFPLWRRR